MNKTQTATADYSLTVRDSAGRTVVLSINGASIDDLIRDGYGLHEAVECVEGNAFQNAIARGEIGADGFEVLDATGSQA
jgi:hypothetical protein